MTFHDRGTNWFLAKLKLNCANIADKNLKRQGLQTFQPMEEETRQRNGKFVTAMRPLFRGYIFVAFDVMFGFWRRANSTYGIKRLVSFGKEPTAVTLDLLQQIMLTKGSSANFVAQVKKIAPDRRIRILMEIMGGQTRVVVGVDQLRSI